MNSTFVIFSLFLPLPIFRVSINDSFFCRLGWAAKPNNPNVWGSIVDLARFDRGEKLIDRIIRSIAKIMGVRSLATIYRSLGSFDRNSCNRSIINPVSRAIVFNRLSSGSSFCRLGWAAKPNNLNIWESIFDWAWCDRCEKLIDRIIWSLKSWAVDRQGWFIDRWCRSIVIVGVVRLLIRWFERSFSLESVVRLDRIIRSIEHFSYA